MTIGWFGYNVLYPLVIAIAIIVILWILALIVSKFGAYMRDSESKLSSLFRFISKVIIVILVLSISWLFGAYTIMSFPFLQ